MEFRTSPGKKGSVQHISESLMDASRPFLALGCRSFGQVLMDFSPTVSDGFVEPL